MVRRVLNRGGTAIILVPEIALTPQMVGWFRDRFGPQTAVLHSRLTDGQRCDEWRRIRLGKARVVIGARSAVFAPVEHLGLIVIDEEHEQTYLSDRHPQYDARRVAKSRCQREGATLLLSSATPSILSFAMARRGDYTLVEMPSRVNHRPMDPVSLKAYYPDFAPYEGDCRFQPCYHQSEPGCAVLAAVERGELSAARVERYHQLLDRVRQACTAFSSVSTPMAQSPSSSAQKSDVPRPQIGSITLSGVAVSANADADRAQ